jgi:hypothetical protein
VSYHIHAQLRTRGIHVLVDTPEDMDRLRELIPQDGRIPADDSSLLMTGVPIYVGTCPCEVIW